MLYLSHHVNILGRRTNQIYPFRHDSAETFGFLASPSARSYNRRVSGSLRCTRSAQIFAFGDNFRYPPDVGTNTFPPQDSYILLSEEEQKFWNKSKRCMKEKVSPTTKDPSEFIRVWRVWGF